MALTIDVILENGPSLVLYFILGRVGMEDVDDLAQLKFLSEQTLLDCLSRRFMADHVYTMTGPVLLALNPLKPIEGLYDYASIREYQRGCGKPHIFSVAQRAYQGMCEAVDDFRHSKLVNQSILISGESGAGKTESTKLVMKYLCLCGHSGVRGQSMIERQILESNPLLEAFGNARTLRNDNSSRFGKFIQLQFSKPTATVPLTVVGAKIETYLLEKVRVSS